MQNPHLAAALMSNDGTQRQVVQPISLRLVCLQLHLGRPPVFSWKVRTWIQPHDCKQTCAVSLKASNNAQTLNYDLVISGVHNRVAIACLMITPVSMCMLKDYQRLSCIQSKKSTRHVQGGDDHTCFL